MIGTECVLCAESAQPHSVKASLCGPSPAKIPESICQIISASIFLLLSERTAPSPDLHQDPLFLFDLLKSFIFFKSFFVLLSRRNFTPNNVKPDTCECLSLRSSDVIHLLIWRERIDILTSCLHEK